jgi:flagellar L-ring protein precursor FlgH
MKTICIVALLALTAMPGEARKKSSGNSESLQSYLTRVTVADNKPSYTSVGSLWMPNGGLTALPTDYKAHDVGDVVIVQIVEDVTATSSSTLNTQRKFQASSGISELAGKFDTSGISQLFSPQSSQQLQGQGSAATKSSIRTSVGGRVVAVLPSGNIVVEARREATANNERQTVFLRGVARPGDIAPDNTVLSTHLSDLELELKGHGVISDASRPPNWVIRTVLKVLGF